LQQFSPDQALLGKSLDDVIGEARKVEELEVILSFSILPVPLIFPVGQSTDVTGYAFNNHCSTLSAKL
jgi:hypothetical protein